VPLPLVFAWHGLGGSGQLARRYFAIEQAAAGAALFVYPDALPLAMFGNRTGWDLRPEGRDLPFFDALLDEVGKSSCVDLARVFSTGHSFGGYMTNTLGCQRSQVLRAIAPVAGGIGGGGCMPPALPAWIAHASNDGVVPFAQGEGARDVWTHAAGCAATSHPTDPSPCVSFDGCRADAPVTWCVHTGNHAWPPFAGEAIWRFFAAW
jgi:poly(3-hydroxybutyrate) depolymerase